MKTRLKDLEIEEATLCAKGKNDQARVLLFKMDNIAKETKTENGVEHPASHFAYVPDPKKPSEWKLRLYDDAGEMTPKQVGMAVAALGAGFRGQKVQIPAEDLPKVKAKVRAAWKKVNPDAKEMPEVLKSDSFFAKMKDFLFGINKNMDQAMTVDQTMEASNAREEWWKLTCAFEKSIMSILQDETAEQASMLTESCMQFINRAKQLAPYMGDMYKAEGLFTSLDAICEDITKAGKKISAANMEKLKAAMQVLQEMMGPIMDDEEEQEKGCKKPKPVTKSGVDDNNNKGVGGNMEFNEILKALPEDQQAAIVAEIEKKALEAVNKSKPIEDVTTIQKQLDEVSKANVQLVKALEVERDIRITKDFIAKAETYKGLPVEAEVFGKMLKEISKKAPEQYEELIKTLDSADKLITENNTLMKELGGNEPPESDALNKLNAIAAEIQKSDPKMTYHVAFGKAMSANPRLYEEYLKQ